MYAPYRPLVPSLSPVYYIFLLNSRILKHFITFAGNISSPLQQRRCPVIPFQKGPSSHASFSSSSKPGSISRVALLEWEKVCSHFEALCILTELELTVYAKIKLAIVVSYGKSYLNLESTILFLLDLWLPRVRLDTWFVAKYLSHCS